MVLDETHRLIAAVQNGLPLTSHPYAEVAEQLGLKEHEVIQIIRNLLDRGIIKRMGIVVRHHELGYHANAMVVWDIPDDYVSEIGRRLGEFDCVTLCYRRPRRLPLWPYNLFCMIHGRNRQSVLTRVDEITEIVKLKDRPRDILFSGQRFKQRGARYASTPSTQRYAAHG